MNRRGARRAVTAHRAATEARRRSRPSEIISLATYSDHVRYQKQLAKARAEEDRRTGVVVLTELTEEQLLEDRRDEALCWPARWW